METKKKQFKMPHTFVIIGIIILLAVLLTWIIPAGSYTRFENEASRSSTPTISTTLIRLPSTRLKFLCTSSRLSSSALI